MLNELGLQSCRMCSLCGSRYGQPDQPPHWRRPTQKVPGEGVLPCDVLILGEGPGEKEDIAGRPFHPDGTAGKFLREMLAVSGLNQARVYITNTVKCRPPGNRKPQPAELASCSPWLQIEIMEATPQFVLCLGDTAMSVFFPGGKVKGKVADWVGKELPCTFPNGMAHPLVAIGCYHPAARQASQRGSILPVMVDIASRLGIAPPAREQTDYQVQEVY